MQKGSYHVSTLFHTFFLSYFNILVEIVLFSGRFRSYFQLNIFHFTCWGLISPLLPPLKAVWKKNQKLNTSAQQSAYHWNT